MCLFYNGAHVVFCRAILSFWFHLFLLVFICSPLRRRRCVASNVLADTSDGNFDSITSKIDMCIGMCRRIFPGDSNNDNNNDR